MCPSKYVLSYYSFYLPQPNKMFQKQIRKKITHLSKFVAGLSNLNWYAPRQEQKTPAIRRNDYAKKYWVQHDEKTSDLCRGGMVRVLPFISSERCVLLSWLEMATTCSNGSTPLRHRWIRESINYSGKLAWELSTKTSKWKLSWQLFYNMKRREFLRSMVSTIKHHISNAGEFSRTFPQKVRIQYNTGCSMVIWLMDGSAVHPR